MTDKLRDFLGPDLAPLLDDGEKLMSLSPEDLVDYSFMVFPFAKTFEGFLKKLFYQIGAITESQYYSDHWRVGKALNPNLEKELRAQESVYDRLIGFCGGGTELADALWETWKKGRNKVFHYFPGQSQGLTMAEAKNLAGEILGAMEGTLAECKIPESKLQETRNNNQSNDQPTKLQ